MFDVLDELIGPLSAHITQLLSQPITGTDDRVTHNDVKKAFLALLNNILASKTHDVFTSPRMYSETVSFLFSYRLCQGNIQGFEPLLESMQGLAENMTDPPGQKAAFVFFGRCAGIWGVPKTEGGNAALPGFERFIYERLVPVAFRVISSPLLNLKDGQTLGVFFFYL